MSGFWGQITISLRSEAKHPKGGPKARGICALTPKTPASNLSAWCLKLDMKSGSQADPSMEVLAVLQRLVLGSSRSSHPHEVFLAEVRDVVSVILVNYEVSLEEKIKVLLQ